MEARKEEKEIVKGKISTSKINRKGRKQKAKERINELIRKTRELKQIENSYDQRESRWKVY